MLARLVLLGCASCVAVLTTAGSADAFGRRNRCTTTTYCEPCPPPCPPCPPCHPCGVFRVSEPPVDTKGDTAKHRKAHVGHGVIVQIDFPCGKEHPTGSIHLHQNGPGEFRYVGYNTCSPAPHNHVRYSVFLCPTKAGDNHIRIGFVMSDGSITHVPFKFDINP
ncbi:hypothetical protein J0H58_09250 [bacterium]|nr:hypothetical protein [bacterium]